MYSRGGSVDITVLLTPGETGEVFEDNFTLAHDEQDSSGSVL